VNAALTLNKVDEFDPLPDGAQKTLQDAFTYLNEEWALTNQGVLRYIRAGGHLADDASPELRPPKGDEPAGSLYRLVEWVELDARVTVAVTRRRTL